ncbi:SMP-30/gluconolactonase/LRE family protein [Mucilaginibacter achroorhodeus]|uniref:SMP-30/gluconolactonase/LRE family protein n=1 Tax=Mucilaginibacter achroorhodeus TaxID=2599294 RepID=A0A563U3S3_9SPHI|nr:MULTISPECIES: SMP-30/gluconolactonase/LRE family protein [Mucilaginibacter]QXV64534.1 SMP-30/gluconolactonase/LRE family protein [Mucilaginibacter sp. 21P]TWR25980.1 SMP-30/gluconolactonase/LRE family protein [Mucilaginibacter achroorhodeus]
MRLLIWLCCCLSLQAFAQPSHLFDVTTKPQLISRQFEFTEGPSVDKRGNIFFTDQPNNKIWEYDINGKLSLFMDKAGRANGTYFDSKGNLVACADEHNQLWQINPKKKVKVLLRNYEGKLFNGPNDLWIDKNDNIYFTDPYFQRDYWTRNKSEMSGQKLFLLSKGISKPIVLDSLVKPNGIVGTPDGKHLFVADIGAGKVYKYEIKANGTITNRQLFCSETTDGITLDELGNLYLAGKGVTIISPKGEQIGHIDIPEPWTANLCFGGKDRKTLFITASKAIYIMRMKVRGVE